MQDAMRKPVVNVQDAEALRAADLETQFLAVEGRPPDYTAVIERLEAERDLLNETIASLQLLQDRADTFATNARRRPCGVRENERAQG